MISYLLSNSDKSSAFSMQLMFNCVFECGDFSVLQSCECVCWTPPRGVYEPSGHTCVAGGYSDGTVRIFSLESAEMMLKLQPQPVSVCALQYSHYGERVCVRLSVLCLVVFVCLCSLYACVCRSCVVVRWSWWSHYRQQSCHWSHCTHHQWPQGGAHHYSAVHQQTGLCVYACFARQMTQHYDVELWAIPKRYLRT